MRPRITKSDLFAAVSRLNSAANVSTDREGLVHGSYQLQKSGNAYHLQRLRGIDDGVVIRLTWETIMSSRSTGDMYRRIEAFRDGYRQCARDRIGAPPPSQHTELATARALLGAP